MKFRDTIAADRDVFLNKDEFAELHDLNGTQGMAIVQQVSADDSFSFGSNIETRYYYELYGNHVEVNCKEEVLREAMSYYGQPFQAEGIPVYGQSFRLDDKLYTVAESKTDLGIVTLILVANDR